MEAYERGFVGTSQDVFSEELFWLLVKHGYLHKVEFEGETKSILYPTQDPYGQDAIVNGCKLSSNPYLGNGLPIESNFENIAKTNLGVCEDRDKWKKELKLAVKEYGHDELLNSFYDWTIAQGTYLNRRPVTDFLKNIGQNLSTPKPTVSSPSLDKAVKGIALTTDNKVVFTGDYRVRLARLVNEHGLTPVTQAFAEFWSSVDEKQTPWAAKEFLQRADVLINTINIREKQSRDQATAVATAIDQYKAEKSQEGIEEDEEL